MSYLTDNYTQKTIEQFAVAAYQIKDADNPERIINTLFELQTELLKKEDLSEVYDPKEIKDIAHHLWLLKELLTSVKNIELVKK